MSAGCSERRETLVDFVDGELTPAERQRVARHLAACPVCQATVERLQQSLAIAGEWWRASADNVSPAAQAPRRRQVRWSLVASATAAAAAILIAIWLPARHTPQPVRSVEALSASITREADAARLLASADVLSAVPGGTEYACTRFSYVVETYPESQAAETARLRLDTLCAKRSTP